MIQWFYNNNNNNNIIIIIIYINKHNVNNNEKLIVSSKLWRILLALVHVFLLNFFLVNLVIWNTDMVIISSNSGFNVSMILSYHQNFSQKF